MDGRKDGWVGGRESRVKDCLQQSKIRNELDQIGYIYSGMPESKRVWFSDVGLWFGMNIVWISDAFLSEIGTILVRKFGFQRFLSHKFLKLGPVLGTFRVKGLNGPFGAWPITPYKGRE